MATTNKEIKIYSLSQVPRGFKGYVLHDRGLGRNYHLYYCCGDKFDLAEDVNRVTWSHSVIETALGVVAGDWNLGWNRGQRSEGNRALLLVGRYGNITRAHMALIMPIILPYTLPIRTINHMHGVAIAYID